MGYCRLLPAMVTDMERHSEEWWLGRDLGGHLCPAVEFELYSEGNEAHKWMPPPLQRYKKMFHVSSRGQESILGSIWHTKAVSLNKPRCCV